MEFDFPEKGLSRKALFLVEKDSGALWTLGSGPHDFARALPEAAPLPADWDSLVNWWASGIVRVISNSYRDSSLALRMTMRAGRLGRLVRNADFIFIARRAIHNPRRRRRRQT